MRWSLVSAWLHGELRFVSVKHTKPLKRALQLNSASRQKASNTQNHKVIRIQDFSVCANKLIHYMKLCP